jgi:aryl-alcohol dehydrogenase-like predicted oxidoreductase
MPRLVRQPDPTRDKLMHRQVGLSKPERVQEMVEAVHLKLTDEECRYLEEPYVPKAARLVSFLEPI